MYVLPGLVDMHGHIGGKEQGTPAEYVFKLWMGHGITTVRDPGSGNGLDWVLDEKAKSAKNEITAPRIEAYVFFGQGRDKPIVTPEEARQWVDEVAGQGGGRHQVLRQPAGDLQGGARRGEEAAACAPPATTPRSTSRGSTC